MNILALANTCNCQEMITIRPETYEFILKIQCLLSSKYFIPTPHLLIQQTIIEAYFLNYCYCIDHC